MDMPAGHDHRACQSDAMAWAERLCARRGARLTDTRRRVLELIWQGHSAVKAYDIIDRFSTDGGATRPPTVYRALDFLLEQGLIHKIESLNAFVGCARHSEGHECQFLVCSNCARVIELDSPAARAVLAKEAEKSGFDVARQTIEIHGLCEACRSEGD